MAEVNEGSCVRNFDNIFLAQLGAPGSPQTRKKRVIFIKTDKILICSNTPYLPLLCSPVHRAWHKDVPWIIFCGNCRAHAHGKSIEFFNSCQIYIYYLLTLRFPSEGRNILRRQYKSPRSLLAGGKHIIYHFLIAGNVYFSWSVRYRERLKLREKNSRSAVSDIPPASTMASFNRLPTVVSKTPGYVDCPRNFDHKGSFIFTDGYIIFL